MNKELIVLTHQSGTDIALLEDKRLVELHQERTSNEFNVGDIYLGKVQKVIPGLNAAFVDVGYEKEGFLHYTDFSPYIRSLMKYTAMATNGQLQPDDLLKNLDLQPEIVKTGNVREVLDNKKYLLVQVLKEPISTKGPRLTCEISIAGRYLVLTPFNDVVGVSKKIDSAEERKRLKGVIEGLKPKNFGVIVRTVAAGKGVAELQEDMNYLQNRWKELTKNLKHQQPVKKVLSEVNKTSGILRDLLNEDFNRVVTNNGTIAGEIEEYIRRIAPDKKDIVNRYSGKLPLFDHYGITRQIKSSFGKTVNLQNGSYLIVEKTEALHVVDVNSGHRNIGGGDQETNALRINMEAAEELARLMRLRDLGGIIVIDFIDLKNPENRKTLFNKMRECMMNDRATHTILPLSKFNLMQITRERVKPEVNISTTEKCPTCAGTGEINASLLLIDQLENDLKHISTSHHKIKIYAHPIICAYLMKGFPSLRTKWSFQLRKWISILPNEDFAITDYKFFDDHDEEIVVN